MGVEITSINLVSVYSRYRVDRIAGFRRRCCVCVCAPRLMPYCEIVSHPQSLTLVRTSVYKKTAPSSPRNKRAMNKFSTRTLLHRLTPAPLSLAQKRTLVVGLPRHSGVVFRCSSHSPNSAAVRPIAAAPALTGLVRGLGRGSRRYKSSMASNGTHELRFSKKSLKVPPPSRHHDGN